jgi:hypothetical protein
MPSAAFITGLTDAFAPKGGISMSTHSFLLHLLFLPVALDFPSIHKRSNKQNLDSRDICALKKQGFWRFRHSVMARALGRDMGKAIVNTSEVVLQLSG